MNKILTQYQALLATVDRWFDDCQKKAGAEIACRRSCTGCCRGLFEISLLDAALLQSGFQTLDAATRKPVLQKAQARLTQLQQQWPEFQPPYILNHLPHDDWQNMPESDATPCPLLSDDGLCLVYAFRPMTCRLHGLPNIDVSGESFSDAFCTLNFRNSDPLTMPELRWTFRATFRQEFDLLAQFSRALTGTTCLELDTFIPTGLLIDFSRPGPLQPPAPETHQDS